LLLQLYCALINSKIYYISFIYSSASKSKLFILGPIHNAGICFATGTFHTSCLTSIYAESGGPLLHFQRDLLLCSYTARLAAHPHHLCYSAVHHKYEMTLRAFQPMNICFQQLRKPPCECSTSCTLPTCLYSTVAPPPTYL